jgi:hypothetical protein
MKKSNIPKHLVPKKIKIPKHLGQSGDSTSRDNATRTTPKFTSFFLFFFPPEIIRNDANST